MTCVLRGTWLGNHISQHAGFNFRCQERLWNNITLSASARSLLGQEPFTEDELREFREDRDELCRRFGSAYERDWGWAAVALNNPRPRFTDIERAVSLSHLRPYFKMATRP